MSYIGNADNSLILDLALNHLKLRNITVPPVNAENAVGVLTFTGVSVNSQTVTIGTDIYEFRTSGSPTAGHIAVDVSGGVTAPESVTALVAAITANTASVVTAYDGIGDTVVCTAKTAGVVGNSIVTTETCTNASWGHAHLLGGVDGTVCSDVGIWGDDSNYIYAATAINTIADKNWVRIPKNGLTGTVNKDIGSLHMDIILTAQERKADIINLTGAGDAGFNLILNVDTIKTYLINNNSGQTVTIKNATGTTATLASGASGFVFEDGTNVVGLTGGSGTTVTLTGIQTLTNKTLTSPVLTTPKIDDGDLGCTITSANQTSGTATITIPDCGDAADEFVLKDTQVTLTNKELTSPVLTSPKVLDDSVLTLGTTTATAETKITMEFDETTTGIGLVNIGTTAVPQVLNVNPGATVIADTINILHSAGAGNCDDLIGRYTKVAVSGAGDSGITVVGDAPRAYVGVTGGANNSVVSQAYGSQPWAKHEGTGAITAMSALSALVDVNADNFTASTVNAGHFHVEGAATVTGQFDGVMIEVYPDVTCLDSGLAIAIDSGAVTESMIRTSGDAPSLLNIAAANTFAVIASGTTMHHDPNAVTCDAHLIVKIGASSYDIPLYDHA